MVSLYIILMIHGRRQWHPTPVLLPGKSHGRRSLVGCSPWGREESDMTERLDFHFSLSCIGKGNGNPLHFLPGESQGRGSLVGFCLWGCTESDTTEVTQQLQQQQQQWWGRHKIFTASVAGLQLLRTPQTFLKALPGFVVTIG